MGKTLRNSKKLRWFFLSCIIILSAAAIATLVAVLLFAFDVTDSGTAVVILCIAVATAAVAAVLSMLMSRNLGVAAVPGSSFFREPVNHLIRLHFARSEETIDEAIRRLGKIDELI